MKFTSDVHALQHFKGKRHSEALALQYCSKNQRGGANHMSRGGVGVASVGNSLGRGNVVGRGRGFDMGRGRGVVSSRGGGPQKSMVFSFGH